LEPNAPQTLVIDSIQLLQYDLTEADRVRVHAPLLPSTTLLAPQSSVSYWFRIVPQFPGTVSLGRLMVRWRRMADASDERRLAETRLALTQFSVRDRTLKAIFSTPPIATLGLPFGGSLVVRNDGVEVADVVVHVVEVEAFLFSGDKAQQFIVPPADTRILRMTLLPQRSGDCRLPLFHLAIMKDGKEMPIVVSAPVSVFVRPRE